MQIPTGCRVFTQACLMPGLFKGICDRMMPQVAGDIDISPAGNSVSNHGIPRSWEDCCPAYRHIRIPCNSNAKPGFRKDAGYCAGKTFQILRHLQLPNTPKPYRTAGRCIFYRQQGAEVF